MSDFDFISRRRFGGLLAAGAAALSAPARASQASNPVSGGTVPILHSPAASMIKPPRLRYGDLIGIAAPAGHTSDDAIERSVKNIEALGFRVRLSQNLRAEYGNYAGSVQQRIDDLHALFLDPEVKAIWAIRGGSGAISLLPALDYSLLRNNPKILIGYSDITALHLAIHRHAGLVTFHGPVASSPFTEYALRHLLAVLMDPQPNYTIPMAAENAARALAEPSFALRTVRGGQASGRLMGGNLCLVSALAGTPYQADFRDAILFLEEVNEAPYRIDRMLTQLQFNQGLEHAAAVMLGICQDCEAKDGEPSLTLDQTLDLHLQPLARPAVSGYSFGHIRDQFTLPVGLMARLDTDSHTLTLLEPAVL